MCDHSFKPLMTQIAFKKALTNILDDFLEKNLDFA